MGRSANGQGLALPSSLLLADGHDLDLEEQGLHAVIEELPLGGKGGRNRLQSQLLWRRALLLLKMKARREEEEDSTRTCV